VADFHGLPHFPNVLNVKSSLWLSMASVNMGWTCVGGAVGIAMEKVGRLKKRTVSAKAKCQNAFVVPSRSRAFWNEEGTLLNFARIFSRSLLPIPKNELSSFLNTLLDCRGGKSPCFQRYWSVTFLAWCFG
jgi:hypothetical protein